MEPKCLLVDYGGVLADDRVPQFMSLLASALGTTETLARASVSEKTARGKALRLDEMTEDAFWTEIFSELHPGSPLSTSPAELTALWANCYAIRPDVTEILREAASAGFRLGVATNVDRYREVYLRDALRRAGLNATIFASYSLGYVKPHTSYFVEVAERLGATRRPDRILYVDDRQSHVDAAIQCGWTALRATEAATIRRWLASIPLD